jgi:hypothetical protein
MHLPDYPTTKKTFTYKVYSKSSYEWDTLVWDVDTWSTGTEKAIVGIWKNDVISDPSFRSVINSGDAEMEITLARPFDNFGEGQDIQLNNTVECRVFDKEAPNGTLIFTGYISSYSPILDDDNSYLTVYVRGVADTLANRMLRDSSGNTTIAYNSKDPSFIMRDIITKFRDNDLGEIFYTANSIKDTNTTVSYTFSTNTYKEALDKVIELCPYFWYYRIDPDGLVTLDEKTTIIDHQISTKKDIAYLRPERNIEDFGNDVYFTGGEVAGSNLFLRTTDPTSIDDYGRVVIRLQDGRVTDSLTAQIMTNRVLFEKSEPTRRTVVRILDSNGTNFPTNTGYDIESIKVGQNIQISELTGAVPNPTKWDNFYWDGNLWDNIKSANIADIMQITSLTYNPDYVEVEATTRLPEISKRIEDIKRNLDRNNYLLNPNAPTNF